MQRRIHTSSALWLIAVLLMLAPAGCGGRGAKGNYPLSGKSYVVKGQRYHILASASGFIEEGEASWYGRDFHGRKTSSGEKYNMHDLTAAHKTLPLQTWVKVTNLANGRDVTVRINDRGPFAQKRIIDLSLAGAKSLGMVTSGTAPVRIEALGVAQKRKVNGRTETVLVQPKSYTDGLFAVQVGSFQEKSNAQSLVRQLKREYGRAGLQVYDRGDAIFYRVHVGRATTLGEALGLQRRLEKQGFRDCFVVAI